MPQEEKDIPSDVIVELELDPNDGQYKPIAIRRVDKKLQPNPSGQRHPLLALMDGVDKGLELWDRFLSSYNKYEDIREVHANPKPRVRRAKRIRRY